MVCKIIKFVLDIAILVKEHADKSKIILLCEQLKSEILELINSVYPHNVHLFFESLINYLDNLIQEMTTSETIDINSLLKMTK